MALGSLLKRCIFTLVLSLLLIDTCASGYPGYGFPEAPLALYPAVTGNGFRDCFINQASLVSCKSLTTGVSYFSRFGVNELAVQSAFLTVPSGRGAFGFEYSGYGFSELTYHSFSVARGLPLSERMSLGVEAGIKASSSPLEEARSITALGEIGIIYAISENTNIGMHIINPVPQSLRRYPVPTAIRAGVGSAITENLQVTAVVEKRSSVGLSFAAGLSYDISDITTVRAGFESGTGAFGFSLACRFAGFVSELSFLTHNRLGISPAVTLYKSFGK